MYLVEKSPGKEELYDSPAELAAAIRSGAVNAESRIFHRTTSTWLPITVHPAYRELAARIAAEGPQPVFPPLPRKQWTFLPFEPESEPGEQARSSAAAASEASGAASAQSGLGEKPRRWLRFWR